VQQELLAGLDSSGELYGLELLLVADLEVAVRAPLDERGVAPRRGATRAPAAASA
jgi:hypothetical protein